MLLLRWLNVHTFKCSGERGNIIPVWSNEHVDKSIERPTCLLVKQFNRLLRKDEILSAKSSDARLLSDAYGIL